VLAYARLHALEWIEDESNHDESLTRNFVRRRLGPLIASRFPQWQRSLARAARHFSRKDDLANRALRQFLNDSQLQMPSEAKLAEMLKQLTSQGARTRLVHGEKVFRVYRDRVLLDQAPEGAFTPMPWNGERRLKIPPLGGELRFKAGEGIASAHVKEGGFEVRLRCGGERLQLDPRRPRRTLKNLFQEAGVPPWRRERLPLLFCGDDLVWVPGLGVDVRYRGRGLIPQWVAFPA
jgi:tRNA(Ile)-lysidine synthase